ncbi:MAG: hypothetical protein BGO31_12690 [Bacteroidetes bacterium 43-16]|nr:MAG: hypothetical protein BGO31_12690 [Bacteroidetes bacterium 43-16]
MQFGDKMRADLFRSLSFAGHVVGIQFPADTVDVTSDYEIVIRFAQLEQRMKMLNPDNELLIVEDNGQYSVAWRQHYCTGRTLFYIPVLSLYTLLRTNRRSGELLLGVACYLIRHAGIPYYRDRSTYAYYQYEMLYEWLTDDPESWGEDSLHYKLNDLNAANTIGDIMGRKLCSKYPLSRLEELSKLIPDDPFGQKCRSLAEMTLRLMKQYPDSCLFEHMRPPFDRDDYDGCIQPDEYFAFVYDTDTWSGDSLIESVSSQLSEYDCIAEPEALTVFDHSDVQISSIDYQIRTIELIRQLCILLNFNP